MIEGGNPKLGNELAEAGKEHPILSEKAIGEIYSILYSEDKDRIEELKRSKKFFLDFLSNCHIEMGSLLSYGPNLSSAEVIPVFEILGLELPSDLSENQLRKWKQAETKLESSMNTEELGPVSKKEALINMQNCDSGQELVDLVCGDPKDLKVYIKILMEDINQFDSILSKNEIYFGYSPKERVSAKLSINTHEGKYLDIIHDVLETNPDLVREYDKEKYSFEEYWKQALETIFIGDCGNRHVGEYKKTGIQKLISTYFPDFDLLLAVDKSSKKDVFKAVDLSEQELGLHGKAVKVLVENAIAASKEEN